jgi:mannose-6-phosphate isomerase-like protein (cupin superfamily)
VGEQAGDVVAGDIEKFKIQDSRFKIRIMGSELAVALMGDKETVLRNVERHLQGKGFIIVGKDFQRPWGGFFVLDEAQADKFGAAYFPGISIASLKVKDGKLSPKVLMVQAGRRLSWQYHRRRSEIWRLVAGTAGVATNASDAEGPVAMLKEGEIVRLDQGLRHRLVGLDGWGMVAEIWQHIDPTNPSDEDDIVRLQDDFGR